MSDSPKESLIALSLQIEEFDLEPEFIISCLRYTPVSNPE
jgi:hypothetical protein